MKTIKLRYCNRRGNATAGSFTRTGLLGQMFHLMAFLVAAIALMSPASYAQSHQDLQRPIAVPAVNSGSEFVDPYAIAGPTIYVTDAAGRLATITMGTYAVHIIGYEGVVLTDIGFDPEDGHLYGISFTSFYRLNLTTGRATYIGPLGISDANALVFTGRGVAYTEGVNSSELYRINVSTGRVSPVGSTAPFKSAGDLTFYNGGLVLSGYYQSSLTNTTPDTLVLLNPTTGAVLAYSELKLANLFGIVSTGKDLLFGFAGTSVYQLFPSQTDIYKRAVLLKNLWGKGLAQIYGAAYNGYFLY
jgi:uncharacterized protein DUF6923